MTTDDIKQAVVSSIRQMDLNHPVLYLNRELTWLSFNQRVMREAEDSRNPLLERLKFLAIVSSNLDEFFMKRIGGLKQQLGAGVARLTVDGRTPKQQIDECYQQVRVQEARQHDTLQQILAELREHDIKLLPYRELSQGDATYIRRYYHENIFPLLTPQSIDPAHPFPFISNLSLNLLVRTRLPGEKGKISLARIKVPTSNGVPRFLQLPDQLSCAPRPEMSTPVHSIRSVKFATLSAPPAHGYTSTVHSAYGRLRLRSIPVSLKESPKQIHGPPMGISG